MRLAMQPKTLAVRLFSPETPLFVIGIIVSLMIVGVAAVVVWSTFITGLPELGSELSWQNYRDVLFHPMTLRGALNTLIVGIGTVLVNLVFAVPLAWLIHRTNTPGKAIFLTLMFLHLLIPTFLKTMGWIILLSPSIGIINSFLRLFIPVESGPLSIYNLPSIAFIQGLSLTPVMFFMVSGAFMAIDPAFEEAAEIAGASRFKSLQRITFPLVAPAIVAAVIYTFMTAVSMFEVAALLGSAFNIHVFSTLMYSALHPEIGLPQYGIGGVYGILLLIPTLVALYFYQRMLRLGHRYATVTGKGYKPKLIDLGGWKWVGASFIGFFFLLDIVLPLLSMVWTSVVPRIQIPSTAAMATVSLNGYRAAISVLTSGDVLTNTVILILSVGIGIMFISVIISWIVVRTHLPGRFVIDTVSMLPHAIPRIATAFSITFIALVFAGQIPLYGSLAAIIFAHTVAWVGFGTRTVNGALIQIHSDLEDAVLTSGGSRIVAMRKVLIPLIASPIAYVAVWTMLLSYSEVTAALLLQSPRNVVLSTAIWRYWQTGASATAAALGTIMVLVMGALFFVLLRLRPNLFLGRRGE